VDRHAALELAPRHGWVTNAQGTAVGLLIDAAVAPEIDTTGEHPRWDVTMAPGPKRTLTFAIFLWGSGG